MSDLCCIFPPQSCYLCAISKELCMCKFVYIPTVTATNLSTTERNSKIKFYTESTYFMEEKNKWK